MIVQSRRMILEKLIIRLENIEDSNQICSEHINDLGTDVNKLHVIMEKVQLKINNVDRELMTFRSRILQLEGVIDELMDQEEIDQEEKEQEEKE